MTIQYPKEFFDGSEIARAYQGVGFFETPQPRYGEFHSLDLISKDGRVLQSSGTSDISEEVRINMQVPPNLAAGSKLVYTVMATEPTQTPSIGTSYQYFGPEGAKKKFPKVKMLTSKNPTIARIQGNLLTRIRTDLKKSDGGRLIGSSAGSGRPIVEISTKTMRDWAWASTGGTNRNNPVVVQDYQRKYSGSRTPGYRKILRDGGRLPVNAHTVSMWRANIGQLVRFRDSYLVFVGSPFQLAESGPFTSYYGSTGEPVHLEQATRVATSKLFKFSGNEIDANLAQDLAQFSQTVGLLSGTLNRITSAVTALKRGNIPGAVTALWRNGNPRYRRGGGPSHTKDLANNWLELQYGWKPLLKDIEGTVNSVRKFRNSSSNSILHVTGSGRASKSENLPAFSPFLGKEAGRTTIETVTSSRMTMNYRISSPTTAFLAQTGFTNPINLLWEVLPWSFVVDWVLPVGPYLESLSAFHGMEFLDGYQTTFTRQITSVTVSGAGPAPDDIAFNKSNVSENGHYSREWIVLSREKMLDFPSQAPPSFRNPISGHHAANALALLVQAFKR